MKASTFQHAKQEHLQVILF